MRTKVTTKRARVVEEKKGSGFEMLNILIDLALDRSWVDVDIDVDVGITTDCSGFNARQVLFWQEQGGRQWSVLPDSHTSQVGVEAFI